MIFQGTRYGLGHHLVYVLPLVQDTMHWLYVTNAAYHTTTAFIKVSLLLQYMRIFHDGIRRNVCMVLLGLVVMWGLAFSFMAWFPCFPVSGFWNRTLQPPAKCYGFGYRTVPEVKITILGFAGTNMAFDIAIFIVPLTEYWRKDLGKKQALAMTGLFTLGFVCVLQAKSQRIEANSVQRRAHGSSPSMEHLQAQCGCGAKLRLYLVVPRSPHHLLP